MFVLNADRVIVFANPACCQWLDCQSDQLTGVRADYHGAAGATSTSAKATALCPPPDLFSGAAQSCVMLIQLSESSNPCVATFHALYSETKTGANDQQVAELSGVVGVVDLDRHQLEPAPCVASEEARSLHAQLRKIGASDPQQLNRDLTVGEDSWVERVNTQTRIAAQSSCNVLISGGPGSKRSELAEKIHSLGSRMKESTWLSQLIPIDCARLEPLSLQKLFTETVEQVRSLDQKSVPCFLMQDIDQLDINAQYELSGLNKLGGLRFRMISTSTRDKQQLLEGDSFQADLVCAIAPLEIAIPPLSARREDIPLLAQMYLEDHNADSERQLAGFTTEALDELVAYNWPENISQFEQFIKEACTRATGDFVTVGELPKQIKFAVSATTYPKQEIEKIDLDAFLAEIESELIVRALNQADGNKTKAAELLGITRARLHRKLGEHGGGHSDDQSGKPGNGSA